jgi:general secretion pathway protein A
MASDMCRHVTCVYLDNPTLTRGEFFQVLASRAGLRPDAERSKAVLLAELEKVVRDRQAREEVTALVVDEAQALPDELLEEIRLLANLETPTRKLLPVVLAGQSELAERLNEPHLRQFKQRIALRCELKRLDLAQTAAYIASRIRTAGGDPAQLFTREAVTLIYEHSHGVPRTISVMCDNALISGLALDRTRIDGDIVREVCRDFDLHRAPARDPQPGGTQSASASDEERPERATGRDPQVPVAEATNGSPGSRGTERPKSSLFGLRALAGRRARVDADAAQRWRGTLSLR